ncbi:hypothetical protein A1O1_02270 [Capronia coronata CBS 617.96]|uniref:DUF4048 domain-containing protein n=1 Tax=Capronia coronata CBS 617.96 TaxID=1182541 RepID=W9YLX4_9EURO|nr:uncharacterized protein A1O1_02270 [Capronia coronata CBS 617.96]EXJ93877.1 hypothetical protein A1O1_02270 [Capronia coronata CBS 617.96]
MAHESTPQLPTATRSPSGVGGDVDGETETENETKTLPSPTRAPATTKAADRRHAKRLSLNLPILLPPTPQMSQSQSQSPTAISSYQSPIHSARSSYQSPVHSTRSSPRIRTSPYRPSEVFSPDTRDPSKSRTSSDFLTLLAAQERRVLELREELQKAEVDLLGLKRQWASYEANKKREEVKHVKKLQPLALDDVPTMSRESRTTPEDEVGEEERRRKRALVEKSQTINAAGVPNNPGRRGSKRVFEGGRHTRALSLLSPTSAKGHVAALKSRAEGNSSRTDGLSGIESETEPSEYDHVLSPPPLSRMSTLDGLISSDPLQLGFGKTYKELAANRRSLPPVAADLLVKQGKQVYDGVREGLWTFWEDIRQATVGEEGINGTTQQQRPVAKSVSGGQKRAARKDIGSNRLAAGGMGVGMGLGLQKTNSDLSTDERERGRERDHDRGPLSKESSFWREFGLDTPQRQSMISNTSTAAQSQSQSQSQSQRQSGKSSDDGSDSGRDRGHVQQKSSTDSTNPPSLLPDLNDNEEEVDDAWDAWDSPVTVRQRPAEPGWDKREGSGSGSGSEAEIEAAHDSVVESNRPPVTRSGSSPQMGSVRTPKKSVGDGNRDAKGGDGDRDVRGEGDDGLPWPEIQKLTTPSKLTRTVSDLMREWNAGANANPNANVDGDKHVDILTTISNGLVDRAEAEAEAEAADTHQSTDVKVQEH